MYYQVYTKLLFNNDAFSDDFNKSSTNIHRKS